MSTKTWTNRLRSLVCTMVSVGVAMLGMPSNHALAQQQSTQLQFDLRTGPDPFTFPPNRAVPVRIHTLFGTQCSSWNVQVESSSLTGGTKSCISLQTSRSTAECTLDTGTDDGSKVLRAQCTTPDGRVLERTQLIGIRSGVAAPKNSYPLREAAKANAGNANASIAPNEPVSSGGGAALGITAAVLGVGAAALALGGMGGGGGSSGFSCPAGSNQCAGREICCPSGTSVYCANSNTCVSQTLGNFGNLCNGGQPLGC